MIHISKPNQKKGMSLIFVVLVMLVLSILSTAIFTLFVSNLNQAQYQEDSIRAHFLAVSGVEVSFAALYQGTVVNDRLVKKYFDKPITTTVNPLSDSIVMDSGTANITVSSYIEAGNRWILITSNGVLNNSTINKTVKMKFRIEYPEIKMWS